MGYKKTEDGVEKYVNTLEEYGNGYSTEYFIVELSEDEAYELTDDPDTEFYLKAYCYNNTWACRNHGMNDSWTDNITEVDEEFKNKFETLLKNKKLKEAFELCEEESGDDSYYEDMFIEDEEVQ